MKITTHTRPQGSALLLALLTAFVICIALTTYLYLVSNQNRSVMRSMAWNSSIPVVEAGVEEALTQVNYVGSTNLASNGWGAMSADGFFHKYNDLGNGFAYDVGVKPPLATGPDQPTIESISELPATRDAIMADPMAMVRPENHRLRKVSGWKKESAKLLRRRMLNRAVGTAIMPMQATGIASARQVSA